MSKISVYRSALTGHWIVDTMGTKGSPSDGYHRQGFRKFADALSDAVEKSEKLSAHVNYRWWTGD